MQLVTHKKVPIVVLGGGPAGASCAISLASKGFAVTIVEKTDYAQPRIGETLPPNSNQIISCLGAGHDLFDRHLPVYCNRSSWGSESLQENNFFCSPYGNGWHLDRAVFDHQLIALAVQHGVKVYLKIGIGSIDETASGWRIQLNHEQGQEIIEAAYLIDATGRNSALTKLKGARKIVTDNLVACSYIGEHRTSPDSMSSNFTLVETLPDGWLYSADLPHGKIILAYMTDADVYKDSVTVPDAALNEKLRAARFTGERCISAQMHFQKVSPAGSYIMSKRCGNNWLAIGDAAMAYDPLSSMGILKALHDGVDAANAIQQHVTGNGNAVNDFAEKQQVQFNKYLHMRKYYYGLETRWKDARFWKRRHRAKLPDRPPMQM